MISRVDLGKCEQDDVNSAMIGSLASVRTFVNRSILFLCSLLIDKRFAKRLDGKTRLIDLWELHKTAESRDIYTVYIYMYIYISRERGGIQLSIYSETHTHLPNNKLSLSEILTTCSQLLATVE